MKLLNLFLILLNVLIFPTVTLAHSPSGAKTKVEQHLLNQMSVEDDADSEDNESEQVEQKEPEIEAPDSAEDDADSEDNESKDESEDESAKKEPTPEEIARLEKLAAADRLYLAGDKKAAVKLYREAKEVWAIETRTADEKEKPATFDDPAQLSPAGKVFWRNYQQGKKQGLETKTLAPLKLLTQREPQFTAGHIHYAQTLLKYEREEESKKVLSRAVAKYPDAPKLLKAKMAADIEADQWLDASILARQYALFNPDAPQAEEFDRLADEYLAKYQSNLRSSIKWNAVGNAIAGTVGFALTGNLFGPLSALQTTSTLLKGESGVGESSVKQIKKQVPLLEDREVNEYVNQIGQKVSAVAGRDEFDYEFHLIMDDNLNAFALPGGKVFVNAGAIMETDSEAELAGLLAHEVAHASLSHGFQLVTKGNLTANIVSYIPYVGNTASSLLVLNYSRSMERQADIFGTQILVNSGYAADGVRNLMAQLHEANQDHDHPEPLPWLSSHPNSKQRIRYMERLIVDRNLNRFAYEGVVRHQEIKKIVNQKWQAYDKCIEDVSTIEEAKKCAGNKEDEKVKDNEERKSKIETEEEEN